MPFNTSIYQQLQPNIAGQLAGSINEFVDRSARLSDLAAQREQQAITQGYQNRAAERAELDYAKKSKKQSELESNLLLVKQALAEGDKEKAKQLFAGMYPEEAAKEMFKAPKSEPMSALGTLQAEREKLAAANPNDPRLKVYDQAINKVSTHPPIAPATSIVEGGAGTFVVTTPRTADGTAKVQNLGIAPKSTVKEQQLSATAQKELFEADETAQAATNVLGLLDQAKALNTVAYSGYGAKQRAIARSNLPGESKEADATINLDNIMTSQALESLKAVFGGMPTEGERKILLDIQASVDKTPSQRDDIMDRAKTAVQNRLKFNSEKAARLRAGEYFKPTQTKSTQTSQPATPSAASANTVLLPNGTIKTFSSSAAAQAFRKAAGL